MNTEILLAEGKTKKIWQPAILGQDNDLVIVESKDDLTAGDGAKHDVVAGKAALANQTTCNVFKLLKECGVPVAFARKISNTRFYARHCQMIPLEVVVRREAHGSFLKRHPHLKKGHFFPKLLLEFFLKTSGRKWKGIDLPKDDPLIDELGALYLPDKPVWQQEPFLRIEDFDDLTLGFSLPQIGNIALSTFLILEKSWQLAKKKLVDFKVEFGVSSGQLLLADVIDNDTWRVVDKDGQYLDKQVYREGGDLNTVIEKYRQVAELTGRFCLPYQGIILWRGSERDDIGIFEKELEGRVVDVTVITRSVHKEASLACQEIAKLVYEVPDSVVIAYVGKSNGAGPTLSTQVSIPVITVPANTSEFPEDVWSSLRMPSNVPVMTVLDPKNAVLAALQILAMRNPRLYAELRLLQEEHFRNMVEL